MFPAGSRRFAEASLRRRPPAPPAGTVGMGIRILVVEDEDAIADFLVRGLREEGFTVERAADGDDGLAPPSSRRPGTWSSARLVAARGRTG